ncbi:ABC-F family ATP-binding cassette domain-containing protein [Cytobacillus sp. Hm23]
MKLLTVENFTKSYTERTLFEHISFSITSGDRIGVIGVNGTGKSTLLKLIAGEEIPDEGQMICSKGYTISYLAQQPVFKENHSVLDQVFHGDTPLINLLKEYEQILLKLANEPTNEKIQQALFTTQQRMDAMNAWEANSNAKAILTKLGIKDYSQQIGELSGGQKKRVSLAQALIAEPDLLILDEPTNHLDHETIIWLEDYLAKFNGAILLVTHDRYFLDRVTNRILELDNGNLYSYSGGYSSFLEGKALREEQAQASEEKRQNLYRHELAWIKRGAKARTTKQKARIKRFEELENSKSTSNESKLDISLQSTRLGKKVVELESITKSYGNKNILVDFNLLIKRGDRIGIVGENGSGKSTLLNLIAGKTTPDGGNVSVGPTVKIGYYTQETFQMNENQRIIEYVKESKEVIETLDGHTISAAQMLERFLFPMHTHGTPIRKLSGGERKRLFLLKILMDTPNVLLLDEPTNDLDTKTLTILEDYLDEFPGVVITVSHDRYFLDKIAEQILVFQGDGHVKTHFGSYTALLEQRTQKSIVKELQKEKEDPKKEKKQIRKLTYKEQKEWETIEDRIAEMEQTCEHLTQQIEQTGSDFETAQSLMKEHEDTTKQLEQLMERWEELSEIIEAIK